MNEKEIEKLFQYLLDWSADNGFNIIIPNEMHDDKVIDFININLKKRTVYLGDLDIEESLTDVG